MDIQLILDMTKVNIGIKHTLKDTYLTNLIVATISELKSRGVVLDATSTDDVMLVSDYVAYKYGAKDSDKGVPENLKLRIANAKMKGRISRV